MHNNIIVPGLNALNEIDSYAICSYLKYNLFNKKKKGKRYSVPNHFYSNTCKLRSFLPKNYSITKTFLILLHFFFQTALTKYFLFPRFVAISVVLDNFFK